MRSGWRIGGIGLAACSMILQARAQADAKPAPRVVYANDFEKKAGPQWSHRSTDVTPKGRRRFLGQFGNDEVRLALKRLGPHQYVRVSFELFIIHSWDGDTQEGDIGPDVWSFGIEGGPQLLRTTFCEHPVAPSGKQTFPDDYPGPQHASRTGAAEVEQLGYKFPDNPDARDAVYRLSFTFPHTAADVTVVFAGSGLQALADESWGLDNVRVELLDGPVRLEEKQLEARWAALQGDDSVKAFGAYCRLMAAGEQAGALLERHLRPKPLDEAAVRRRVAALDAKKWTDRQKATEELRRMGKAVAPLLREARQGKVSAEAATRIDQLLDGLSKEDLPLKDLARYRRMVRLLGILGSQKAVAALAHLRRDAAHAEVRHMASVTGVQAARPLIDELLRQAEERARDFDFRAAQAACGKAVELAKASASPAEGRVAARLAELGELAKVHEGFARLARRLPASRDDPSTRNRLIRMAVVDLDSPAKAAAYLNAQSGKEWRRYVPLAARDGDGLAEADLLALAKWYRGLAGQADGPGKAAMLRRARRYFGLYVARLRRSIGEMEDASESIADELSRAGVAKPIDLLQHLYPKVHRLSGEWVLSGRTLRVSPAGYARLALPIAPRGDYELTADFVRRSGSGDVNFVLPVGSAGVLLTLDDNEGNSGLLHVDGRDLMKPNPPHTLANGKTYRLQATVRRRGDEAAIRITLDGKEYMQWRGPAGSLSVRQNWAVSKKGALGLGAHESAVEFSRVRLRMLSGRAAIVRMPLDRPGVPRPVEIRQKDVIILKVRRGGAQPRT